MKIAVVGSGGREHAIIKKIKENPQVETIMERDSWRAQKNLVSTRTQEKGAMTPQKTDPDLPRSVQESPVEAWVGGSLLQDWGH